MTSAGTLAGRQGVLEIEKSREVLSHHGRTPGARWIVPNGFQTGQGMVHPVVRPVEPKNTGKRATVACRSCWRAVICAAGRAGTGARLFRCDDPPANRPA